MAKAPTLGVGDRRFKSCPSDQKGVAMAKKEDREQEEARRQMLEMIAKEPVLAHEYLFSHRHPNITPDFHKDMINLWHDITVPEVAIQAFRGGAKSTVGCEEATIIMALLGVFKNGIIIGERFDRAVERLDAIKHELETNEKINFLFGDPRGKIWKEGKIELFNSTVIQAIGQGQSMRGAKHHDQRPDYCVGDDIEDDDNVRTEEAKKSLLSWFMSVVMPAMDKEFHLIRIVGTPLDTNSLMETLTDDEGWQGKKYPIEYIDHDGNRQPTWPDRFPLDDIDARKERFERMGLLLEYGREYMCEARTGETRQFTEEIIRVEPRARRWEAVYSVHDPARTANKDSSDHTGKAVFSWIGDHLKIWEASGHFWMPDQIVNDIFDTADKYDPVVLGVEKTGLEEFIMQPIRNEMSKRNQVLPIRALDPPRGPNKLDFIRGLQPFFANGQASMAEECEDLRVQLLNFPAGRIDVPNALAYAMKLRPGLTVYREFNEEHIAVDYYVTKSRKAIAINHEDGCLTGVIYEKTFQGLVIIDNVIYEGDPNQRCRDLLQYARYVANGGQNLDVFVHPSHFEKYSTSGLIGALRKEGCEPRKAGDVMKGRGFIIEALRTKIEGRPIFRVSTNAKHVLNGFSAGYAFEYNKIGKGLADRANPGMYRTLIEGLECAMAIYTSSVSDLPEQPPNFRTDSSGRTYLSTMPQSR